MNWESNSDATNINLKKEFAEIPCQNCDRLVTVSLPFVGCVFCGDCAGGDSGWNDGAEGFYDKRRGK